MLRTLIEQYEGNSRKRVLRERAGRKKRGPPKSLRAPQVFYDADEGAKRRRLRQF